MPKHADASTILNNVIVDCQIGESLVVNEDLTNLIDVGTSVINWSGSDSKNYDTVIRKLIDRIAISEFADKIYKSRAPKIRKTSAEYGAIRARYRDITERNHQNNASWDLSSYPILGGAAYPDPFEITKENITTTIWSDRLGWEIPYTIPFDQWKTAWSNASEMLRFISMIKNHAESRAQQDYESFDMAVINNRAALNMVTHNGVVNILAIYNAAHPGSPLTTAEAFENPDILRNLMKSIETTYSYMQDRTILYNNDGVPNFSSPSDIHAVMLEAVKIAAKYDLYSNTINREDTTPDVKFETVTHWQGVGTSPYDTAERAKLDITTTYDPDTNANGVRIVQDGVVAMVFDDAACCTCQEMEETTSQPNNRGRYENFWKQFECSYQVDMAENFVVFVISKYDWDPDANGASAPASWATDYTNYVYFDDTDGTYKSATSTWAAHENYYKIVATA